MTSSRQRITTYYSSSTAAICFTTSIRRYCLLTTYRKPAGDVNAASLGTPDRYVEGALVRGSAAWLLSRILASPGVATVVNNPPRWVDRVALAATVAAIHTAARRFDTASAACEREDATVLGAVALESNPEWTVRRAAGYLKISERRTQELAAKLGGRKIGRQWLLEETAVRQEHEKRKRTA
jgi:hypothetical protein